MTFMLRLLLVFIFSSVQVTSMPLYSASVQQNRNLAVKHMSKVKDELAHNVDNVVKLARSLPKKNASNDQYQQKFSVRCSACIMLVNYELWKLNRTKAINTDGLKKWMLNKCEYFHLEAPEVCRGTMKIFGDEVIDVFTRVHLPAEDICGISLPDACTEFHHLSSKTLQWNVALPPRKKLQKQEVLSPDKSVSKKLKVLHFSDVHIDTKYQVGSNTACDTPLCCRKEPSTKSKISIIDPLNPSSPQRISEIKPEQKAMKWGDHRNCDLPLHTFDNLLQQLSNNITSGVLSIDYIIFTGDIPAHDVWSQTKSSQLDIISSVTLLLKKYFPTIPVYPAVGNHDSFPSNNFPPDEVQTAEKYRVHWLYSALANIWKPWLSTTALETVQQGGYYTMLVKPGFRIISLNTNFCYSENLWLWLDPSDPSGMLAWFVRVLETAEANNEQVQVIGHVPPGRDPECLSTWSENYFRIIERFNEIITAQFFGHTHYDELALFYNKLNNAISTAYLAPSLTTYTGMQPAFRVYTVDGFHKNSTWSVTNHQTYVLDLVKANISDNPLWELEYDACQAYNFSILNHNVWSEEMGNWLSYIDSPLKPIPRTLVNYAKFFMKKQPYKNEKVHGVRENLACNLKCLRNIVCNIGKNTYFPVCSER